MLELFAPPLPTFVAGGEMTYRPGQCHPDRRDIGVFDLLIVMSGRLCLGEQAQPYEVAAGQFLFLYPAGRHYPTRPCTEDTRFYWFHFLAPGGWQHIDGGAERKNGRVKRRHLFAEQPFSIYLPKYGDVPNIEAVGRLCEQLVRSMGETAFFAEWRRHLVFQQLLQELCADRAAEPPSHAAAVAAEAAAFLRKKLSPDHSLSRPWRGASLPSESYRALYADGVRLHADGIFAKGEA